MTIKFIKYMFVPLGPRRPIRRPKPTMLECTGGNFIFIDASAPFEADSEVFVCTEETIPEFALLESGNYTLEDGTDFEVIDGILQ